jgi:hypothetical protein
LYRARAEISDLQEELQEKNNLYLTAIKERDAGTEKLTNAKDSLNRYEALIKQQVDKAMARERAEHNKTVIEKEALQKRINALENENTELNNKNKNLAEKIRDLQDKMEFFNKDKTNVGEKNFKQFDELRAEADRKEREAIDLKKHVNYLQDQIEDLMAENKVLRDMKGVPENYGIDREKIKLLDREKIDDFKKLIRVLQEDNYALEEERAKLKHELKQQSMMQVKKVTEGGAQPIAGYDLSEDQVNRVYEFVNKLLRGQTQEPSDFYALRQENEKLKAQMEALKEGGFNFIKVQIETLFKDFTIGQGGMSPEQFDRIRGDYSELKQKLDQMIMNGGNPGFNTERSAIPNVVANSTLGNNSVYGAPPTVQVGENQMVSKGFSHKFQSPLYVTGRNGDDKGVDAVTMYDNAFLQLQLQECFEIIDRKDQTLKQQKREIDTLYNRVKRYLLMQDHLYKDHIELEKEYTRQLDLHKANEKEAKDQLNLAQVEKQKLSDAISLVKSAASPEDLKARVVDLTKQNALLEINLIRMTRKYQTLEQ